MNRRIAVAASVVGILAGGLGLAEAAHAIIADRAGARTAPATGASADSIRWGPCTSGELPPDSPAVCGMLAVPLDYAKPAGTQIQIALSMVRHSSPEASYQGAILVNPGGPGAPGLAMSGLGQRVPDGMGAGYDWIGFDPRGVGDSRPVVSCDPAYFHGPQMPYVPASTTAVTRWLDRAHAYSAACAKNSGALLDHVTTVDAAHDLDSIRKALGQKQISYYGYSYGTYLGQVYATLYPTHLHRLVLDSNVDPRGVWYQLNLAQDIGFDANMNTWFGWLASHDDAYHLGSTRAAVSRLFSATQARLQTHPLDGELGGDEWRDLFMRAGYYQHSWVNLGRAFSEWAVAGQSDRLLAYYHESSADEGASYPGYLAVECTDTLWPQSVAKNLADSRRVALKAPFSTWQNQWFNAPCLTWPAKAHQPVTIDGSAVADALLVDQTRDAATPYEGSLQVRALFPHAALLSLPGGTSHADSLSGYACEDYLIANYLRTGALPLRKAGRRADATCPAPPLPVP